MFQEIFHQLFDFIPLALTFRASKITAFAEDATLTSLHIWLYNQLVLTCWTGIMTVVEWVITLVVTMMCNFAHSWLLRFFVSYQYSHQRYLPCCQLDSLTHICWSYYMYIYIQWWRMFTYIFSEFEKESMYVRANFPWFNYFKWNHVIQK